MDFSKSSKDTGKQPLLQAFPTTHQVPAEDSYNLAYMVYFTMGTGFPLPSDAFITAIDYFAYIYPGPNINRKFSLVSRLTTLITVIFVVGWARKSDARIRINLGLILFIASLLTVPIVDLVYVRGRVGLYLGYYVTLGAVLLCGVGTGLVQSGVTGSAGELPKRYMQATNAGMGAAGVIVSVMRIISKAIYPHDAKGLRSSANLYFIFSTTIMAMCLICCNISHHLPVINYYKQLKMQAIDTERKDQKSTSKTPSRSTLWEIVGRVKWMGLGKFILFVVTVSIFPGCLTEDVHSQSLKDWYPIILVTVYQICQMADMAIPAVYLIENVMVPIIGSFARLLFYPLFYVCLHGPKLFRTEIPVTILTCLLGLTSGYFASLLLILAPKAVPIQHSETAAIVMAFFSVLGLSTGSVVAWLWVI